MRLPRMTTRCSDAPSSPYLRMDGEAFQPRPFPARQMPHSTLSRYYQDVLDIARPGLGGSRPATWNELTSDRATSR